jgi:hypothetical protein
MTIADLDKQPDLTLVTDSQDVGWWLDFWGYGKRTAHRDGGLFILTKDGDLERMYAFSGSVPLLTKVVTRLRPQYKNHGKIK